MTNHEQEHFSLERLMHPQQIVHGGVIFTLADTAMSMALISVLPAGTRFGTLEAKINFG